MVLDMGLEPIQMHMSGGHLLPPVQKLVATLIFAHSWAKMQIESYIVPISVHAGDRGQNRSWHNIQSPAL